MSDKYDKIRTFRCPKWLWNLLKTRKPDGWSVGKFMRLIIAKEFADVIPPEKLAEMLNEEGE